MISREGLGLARTITGFGFFDERVKLSGIRVRFNLLVPKFFAVFLKPVGHSVNFLGSKLRDGGFYFLHRAHIENVSGL
jgi:hypothetical protein